MTSNHSSSPLSKTFSAAQIHVPSIQKYEDGMPNLYAFRMAADEIGAIPMAQGSPLFGPPAAVIKTVADIMAKCAERAAKGESTFMDGYLEYGNYQHALEIATDFLIKTMKIKGDRDQILKRIVVGGYARTTMQNFLDVVASKGGVNRLNDRMILTPGCWPLIFDIAEKMGIKHLSTGNEHLDFADYKEIIEAEDVDGAHILYFCDPNNPLDHKYSNEDIRQFLKDLVAYSEETGKKIIIIADNPYWGWCSKEYLEKDGFPSFTRVADELLEEEGISAHSHLVEIFSLSKAVGLASNGGSIALHNSQELVVAAHKDQTSFIGLPGYPQLLFIMETLKYAMEHPEFILERSANIHRHLTQTHRLVEEKFRDSRALKIKSCDEHGAYIAFALDDSLFGKTVAIKGRAFKINDARDVCIYLLDEHGVALTPVDPRDDLNDTVRMFVDLAPENVDKGVERFIAGMGELVKISQDPAYDVGQHLTPVIP